MKTDDVFAQTAGHRLLIADVLTGLDEQQWQHPTLCAGWTVRDLAGHLLQPFFVGFGRFFLTALRFRGDTDRTVDHLARRIAARPPGELVQLLREHASDRLDPPRVGPMGPFADTAIHLRDLTRPLGLDVDLPAERWRSVLAYLTGPEVAPALVPRGRLDGIALRASDVDWSAGRGELLEGPAEALAMAASGRRAALADLDGPGVSVLSARLPAAGG
jgi:uncharacterized protein (TIGR03083 family)